MNLIETSNRIIYHESQVSITFARSTTNSLYSNQSMTIKRLVLFFILNFFALFLGGMFTETGPGSWYDGLNKAPWTPPGWVFGAAWTSIMICFSFYMAKSLGKLKPKNKHLILYGISWVLNVIWNPIFFYLHNAISGLVIISALTLVILFMLVGFRKELRWNSLLILPYLMWLCIATSLNLYVCLYN